jgi:hypothetical protein
MSQFFAGIEMSMTAAAAGDAMSFVADSSISGMANAVARIEDFDYSCGAVIAREGW